MKKKKEFFDQLADKNIIGHIRLILLMLFTFGTNRIVNNDLSKK